jgi:hypothetical protein
MQKMEVTNFRNCCLKNSGISGLGKRRNFRKSEFPELQSLDMTCFLNKRDEIVLHPPCVVLGDTEIFIQDKYRKKVLRYSIYGHLSHDWPLFGPANRLNTSRAEQSIFR